MLLLSPLLPFIVAYFVTNSEALNHMLDVEVRFGNFTGIGTLTVVEALPKIPLQNDTPQPPPNNSNQEPSAISTMTPIASTPIADIGWQPFTPQPQPLETNTATAIATATVTLTVTETSGWVSSQIDERQESTIVTSKSTMIPSSLVEPPPPLPTPPVTVNVLNTTFAPNLTSFGAVSAPSETSGLSGLPLGFEFASQAASSSPKVTVDNMWPALLLSAVAGNVMR
ncbi:hypothetical protein CKAH01_17178 [Colletotrichum kahawae]|uniref:Uncharacterized protein n=1 Tax=Colletotrichum kahawae TaxID=34407 RepID=A0AAD9YDT5_COLKA|nr:hypothetical protein CKAH01_17178 [Colletotrichum kahawae]